MSSAFCKAAVTIMRRSAAPPREQFARLERVAKKAHMRRESLHRMLSRRGNPEWNSMFRVLKAIHVRPRFESAGRA